MRTIGTEGTEHRPVELTKPVEEYSHVEQHAFQHVHYEGRCVKNRYGSPAECEAEAQPPIDSKVIVHREAVLDEAAQRTHALLAVAKGTAGCPSVEKIRDDLAGIMEYINYPEYADLDTFACSGGYYVRIAREQRHWDYVEVLVPATPKYTWMRDDPFPAPKPEETTDDD